jgi:hypothetical protein
MTLYPESFVKDKLYIKFSNAKKAEWNDFLNPALALLEQGLKKSPIGQKLDFANHPKRYRYTGK